MTVRDETTTLPGGARTTTPNHLGGAALLPGDSAKGRAPRLLAAGGILAALGAASCCVIPFALFLGGATGAWIGNLTALEPYQPIFAAVSLGFIGFGAWRLRQKRQVACADGYCATPQSDRIARIGLWTASVLVVVAVGFPYAVRYYLAS